MRRLIHLLRVWCDEWWGTSATLHARDIPLIAQAETSMRVVMKGGVICKSALAG